MKLRHSLFQAGSRIVEVTSADRWLTPLTRGFGVILTFHHVRPRREQDFAPHRYLEVTPESLERVIILTRRLGFETISLDEIPYRMTKRSSPPFVAFTFDDGYRDNLEHAAPVLSKHGVPWTMFVTAAFADGNGRLWWLELQEAIARLEHIDSAVSGLPFDLPLRTTGQKQHAFNIIYRYLLAGQQGPLLRAVSRLTDAAKFDSSTLVRDLCLSWDDLRALSYSQSVTIGAHTLAHPRLSGLMSHDAAQEIGESRRVIEERLNVEVRHFAFPYGGADTAGPREFALARAANFHTALTTRPDHVRPKHVDCLHALPRVQISGLFQNDAAFKTVLSGVPFVRLTRSRRATRDPA